MRIYVLRRLGLVLPTLVGVTLLVSGLIRLLPGDSVSMMLQDYAGYAKDIDDLRAKLGLSQPFHEQYLRWAGDVARGNLGLSLRSQTPIADELKWRAPVTLELGLMGLLISLTIAIPIGIISAVRQDSGTDYVARSAAIAMLAIPGFWLGTLAILLPSLWFHWTPPLRYTSFLDDPAKNLTQMVLPAIILGIGLSGAVMRLTRAQMLEVLRQDYLLTVKAKGFAERYVISRHALRNSIIPIVTLLALQVPILVSGAVVLESIFAVPGMGRYLLDAINNRDYPIVEAVVLAFAVVIVFSNLFVDLLYAWLDPRIRYS